MTGGKRWPVVLTIEQTQWIEDTSVSTGLKGSDIIREMVDRQMNDNPDRFRKSLKNAQLKIKLQALNDKKVAIEEEEAELKKQMSIKEREAVNA